MQRVRILAVLFLTLAQVPWNAAAAPARTGPVEAELVAEQLSIVPGEPFWVALRLKMDPGWHTYWLNPGDSGLPTRISWELPAGFTAGPVQWPYPRLFDSLGVGTYGYTEEVALLMLITPTAQLRAGATAVLSARADWLACEQVCIPGSAELTLRLPVSSAKPLPDRRWTKLFRAQRDRLPQTEPGLSFSAQLRPQEVALSAQGFPTGDLAGSYFFSEVEGLVSSAEPQAVRRDGSTLTLRLVRPQGSSEPPARLRGVLVVPDAGGERALLVDAPVLGRAGRVSALSFAAARSGLLLALVFAFLGGILLNLMPCVLPVLSLKLMSFVQKAHSSRKGALLHSLVFSLGVLVSFWLIVGLLLALRAGGQSLGWGFQFQNPGVVMAAAALFFLLGLNMFGVFEIGVGLGGLGAGLQARRGWAGSFFSGFLATAVATPCTAPFMGSALGFALAQPPALVFAVFTALALGMSLPYVVLSASPGLMRLIPRPGKWMETLKQIMGFPLMASAVWMASVLVALSGPQALIALLGAFFACALAAWVFGRWGGMERSRAARVIAGCLALLLVAGGLAFAIRSAYSATPGPAEQTAASPGTGIPWQPYSPELIEELRAQGQRVFIDFSAKWCLTCQVNERIALRGREVERRFRELGIVAVKADWTDRSETIARAIAGYGRAGVPLYVLYGRGAEQPVLLPEILTPGIVLEAVARLP